MKTRLFIPALIVLSFGLFYSCNTEEVEGGPNNYWDSNALTKMKLRGAVHTMTENATVFTFNSDGNVISQITTLPDNTFGTTYNYENGKLVSETFTNSASNKTPLRSESFHTTYEYENVGKYIPNGVINLFERGLVRGLSAIIKDESRVDIDIHGSNLWMVNTYQGIPSDTTIVEYSGNLPSNISSYSSYCNNLNYASNGMFLSYSNGHTGSNFSNDYSYTFVPSDTFLIVDRIVNTSTYGTQTSLKTTDYTYNDHLEMTEEASVITGFESAQWKYQWTDYVYDSAGNWITRKFRSSTGATTWSEYTTETRSFTYY